jgi:surface protein
MAIQVNDKALVLTDEIKPCGEETTTLNRFRFRKTVTLETPLGDGGWVAIQTDNVGLSADYFENYVQFQMHGGDAYGDAFYTTADGLTYTLESFRFDNMMTDERTEDPSVFLDFGQITGFDGDGDILAIAQFLEQQVVDFNGIYSANPYVDYSKAVDLFGRTVTLPFDLSKVEDTQLAIGPSNYHLIKYCPSKPNIVYWYDTCYTIYIDESNKIYALRTGYVSQHTNVLNEDGSVTSTNETINLGDNYFLVNEEDDAYVIGSLVKEYNAWPADGGTGTTRLCDNFIFNKIQWDPQYLGLNLSAKDVLPGRRGYGDNGVVDGQMDVIDSSADLYPISNLLTSIHNNYAPESFQGAFQDQYEMTDFPISSILNTKNCNNFSYMFYTDRKLTNLDISNFDLSKVKETGQVNFQYFLYDCPQLTSVSGLKEKLYEMAENNVLVDLMSAFYNCSNLELVLGPELRLKPSNPSCMFSGAKKVSVDVSNWDFSECTSLTRLCSSGAGVIGYENIECPKVTTMAGMFYYGTVPHINLDNIKAPKVSSLENFCYGNSTVETVSIKNPNIGNESDSTAGTCKCAFMNCTKLKKVDMTNFWAKYYYDCSGMFSGCTALEECIIPRFDLSAISRSRTMNNMFYNCKSLKKLDIRNLNLSSMGSYSGAFTNVPSDCLIIVGTDNQRNWLKSKFSSLTNIKLPSELEE